MPIPKLKNISDEEFRLLVIEALDQHTIEFQNLKSRIDREIFNATFISNLKDWKTRIGDTDGNTKVSVLR